MNVLDNEIIFRESDRPLGKTSLKPLDQLVFMLICFKEEHSDVNRESFSGIGQSNDENFTSFDEYYKTTVYLFKKYEIMPLTANPTFQYLLINEKNIPDFLQDKNLLFYKNLLKIILHKDYESLFLIEDMMPNNAKNKMGKLAKAINYGNVFTSETEILFHVKKINEMNTMEIRDIVFYEVTDQVFGQS